MSLKNLIGKKFHRLTVLSEEPARNYVRYFKCRCDCGNIKITQGVCLNNGSCKSCGCLQKEKASKLGKSKKTHGFSKMRFYRIWKGIKNRCYNERSHAYLRYGGRGICMAKRWHRFENFKDDMYPSYLLKAKRFGERNISIHRANNDGNYCVNNCEWTTIKIQNSNRPIKKLTKDDIGAIRREYRHGNGKLLSKKHGVSAAVISEIVNHKRNYT